MLVSFLHDTVFYPISRLHFFRFAFCRLFFGMTSFSFRKFVISQEKQLWTYCL